MVGVSGAAKTAPGKNRVRLSLQTDASFDLSVSLLFAAAVVGEAAKTSRRNGQELRCTIELLGRFERTMKAGEQDGMA